MAIFIHLRLKWNYEEFLITKCSRENIVAVESISDVSTFLVIMHFMRNLSKLRYEID